MARHVGELVRNETVAYHRNGVSGEGFYAVTFDYHDEDDKVCPMVATVFDAPGHVAVLHRDNPTGRPMRGDQFEPELRAAVQRFNRRQRYEWRKMLRAAKTAKPARAVEEA